MTDLWHIILYKINCIFHKEEWKRASCLCQSDPDDGNERAITENNISQWKMRVTED
jgi:hypothetical protein